MFLLNVFTLNKNNEILTRKLLSPTGDWSLVTLLCVIGEVCLK